MKKILILLCFLLIPTICFAVDANDNCWSQLEEVEEPADWNKLEEVKSVNHKRDISDEELKQLRQEMYQDMVLYELMQIRQNLE